MVSKVYNKIESNELNHMIQNRKVTNKPKGSRVTSVWSDGVNVSITEEVIMSGKENIILEFIDDVFKQAFKIHNDYVTPLNHGYFKAMIDAEDNKEAVIAFLKGEGYEI